MRAVLVLLVVALCGCAGPAVTQTYDRFKNTTTFQTLVRAGSWGDELDVNFYGNFGPGTENPSTSLMIVALGSLATTRLEHDFPLILLVEGQRHELETDVSAGRVSTYGSGSVTEYIHANPSLELIEKMATAGSVEGQLGLTEFALDKGDQERLQKFVEALKTFKPESAAATGAAQK